MALLAGQFYLFLYKNVSRPLIVIALLYSFINSATLWGTQRSLLSEYKVIATKLANHQPLASGTGYALAEYLRRENPLREPVYLMDFHIAYWLTDTKPLLKVVTHPSAINKKFLVKLLNGPQATSGSVMLELLRKKPLFIVKRKGSRYLKNRPEAYTILEKTLRTDYALVEIIQKAHVYKRKGASG